MKRDCYACGEPARLCLNGAWWCVADANQRFGSVRRRAVATLMRRRGLVGHPSLASRRFLPSLDPSPQVRKGAAERARVILVGAP